MKLSKIPKHIWWGMAFPLVLVSLGIWRIWPKCEEYILFDQRAAKNNLFLLRADSCWVSGVLHEMRILSTDLRAEAVPLESSAKGLGPFHGYYFIAFICDNSIPLAFSRTFYCAYPSKQDWRHRRTFIINESSLFSIDNGGRPITIWPTEKALTERFTKLD